MDENEQKVLNDLGQRGLTGKGVVFTTTVCAWSGFNAHPGRVVAFLDKTLYDDYLCLVTSWN